MLSAILVILIILWVLGYMPISGMSIPNPIIFSINEYPISLWNILTLLVIVWAIGILPRPFQTIASVLLVIWVLSILGVLAIGGLPNIIVLLIIFGLVAVLVKG